MLAPTYISYCLVARFRFEQWVLAEVYVRKEGVGSPPITHDIEENANMNEEDEMVPKTQQVLLLK